MNFQGTLANGSGSTLPDGDYQLTFRLWNAANGGSVVWTENQTVSQNRGIFNAVLGLNVQLAMSFDEPYWLSVQVGQDAELSPRTRLTSVPYAIMATAVPAGSIGSDEIATGAVTGAEVQDGALAADDLGDEPGLSMNALNNQIGLGTTPVDLTSSTITIPAPGYVIAMGNAHAGIVHATGTSDRIDLSISQTSGGMSTSEEYFLIQLNVAAGTFFIPMHIQQTYHYDTAGTKTVYLVAESDFGTDTYVRGRSLILLYVPTTYGTVTPNAALPPGGEARGDGTQETMTDAR